jgi:hypothetical protein
MREPFAQKQALIESLTIEQMLAVYTKEFRAILSCSKIPHVIFQRILNGQSTPGMPLFEEQLCLLRNRHLDPKYLQHFAENSPFDLIREVAAEFIHIEKNSLDIAMDIINRAGRR